MSIFEFTSLEHFDNFLSNFEGLLVVDFFATWCGPCQMMLPIIERTSCETPMENVFFAKINRDENRDLIDKYGFVIPTIPRFFVVKVENGKLEILQDLGGTQSKTQLITKITPFLHFAKANPELNANFKTDLTQILTNKSSISSNSKSQPLDNDSQTFSNSQNNPEISPNSDKNINNPVSSKKPKIAVIGTGPSGLTAAIYAARASLDVTAFAGPMPGGQLTTTTEIENFPGAWDMDKKEGLYGTKLMAIMQDQAEYFGTKVEVASVENLQFEMLGQRPQFTLTVAGQNRLFDAVIIASGATARYLGVDGENKYIGRGYHSCATCDGAFYRDKIVAIVGGGDSAMEEADFLTKFATKVYLLHRSQKFRASQVMLDRAKKNPKIQIITDVSIVEMTGQKDLQSVILQNNTQSLESNPVLSIQLNSQDLDQSKSSNSQTNLSENSHSSEIFKKLPNNQVEMKLDGLFVAIGHDPNTTFVANLLDKNEAGYLIPQSRLPKEERTSKYQMATRIPGVFLAGDVEDYEYRQAITAAAGGCRAAMELEKWLADFE